MTRLITAEKKSSTTLPYKSLKRTSLLLCFLAYIIIAVQSASAIDFKSYISEQPQAGSFTLSASGKSAPLYINSNDYPGVIRALKDLQLDIKKVTGIEPVLSTDASPKEKEVVLVGTLGKSPIIDQLVKENKINVSDVTGQWETFIIQVVDNPLSGIDRALVIAGSDKRGTIYGIYDISEQIGVSPWHFWADTPVRHKDALYIKPGRNKQGPPSVKYRGIFINDEAPDLSDWVRMTYGTVPRSDDPPIPSGVSNYNSEFYKTIFEAILRMKGNYLWPAMWNNAFNEDDPLNPKLADEYGIVMGTSHQEPMIRAQKEWDRRYRTSWNYYRQPEQLQQFWREGIRRNKDYESIITIGLRGANDTPMIPGGTVPQSMALLEEIVAVQRQMISEEYNKDITEVPQLWCLYKEVQEYYERGLRVPDDVTLLWADDNWGNVRRLPTEAERNRTGGAGIYYHLDYVGGPRCYKWVNTGYIPQIWEQMTLAKEYGADRIWIVNVGHFKHLMFPMEYFIRLGWNTQQWTNDNLREYTELWCEREFGPQYAAQIAEIITQYTRYNARRKPELLEPLLYSVLYYREAETFVNDFNALVKKAEDIYNKLPADMKEAFYEHVLFPTKASAQVTELYVTAGINALYAYQKRASANDKADKVAELFQADQDLMAYYNNTFADGKWNHFMDQTHIGYTNWQQPNRDTPPRVQRIEIPEDAALGVAVEHSDLSWPGPDEESSLPQFDIFNKQTFYIDVFNRGQDWLGFTATASQPWIMLSMNDSPASASIGASNFQTDRRIEVSIDWTKAPKGTAPGSIQIVQTKAMRPGDSPHIEFSQPLPGGDIVTVNVEAFNPTEITPETLDGFIEGNGYVSIEAEHFTRNVPSGNIHWEKIEDYGRTLSGMTIMPVTTKSVTPPANSPCLEYKMYLFGSGEVEFRGIVGPSLNFDPARGTHIAVSFDDQPPQVIEILPKGYDPQNGNRTWEESVRNYCYVPQTKLTIDEPGYHTFKVWMVDAAVVLQKVIIDLGGLKYSYLGPPESFSN